MFGQSREVFRGFMEKLVTYPSHRPRLSPIEKVSEILVGMRLKERTLLTRAGVPQRMADEVVAVTIRDGRFQYPRSK